MSLKDDFENIDKCLRSGNEFERLTTQSALSALVRLMAKASEMLESFEDRLKVLEEAQTKTTRMKKP